MTNQLTRGGAEGEREFPLFLGVVQVLDLIKELYQRRRRPQRREFTEGSRTRRRGPKWLPLLCLVRPERQSALLPALSSWLNEADPHRVPHAYVELTPDRREPTREPRDTKPPRGPWGPRDVELIRDNLRNIANALADSRNGRTRHLRFPRFGLAYWLMKQELSDYEPSERRAQLRKELRKRSPDPLRVVDDTVSEANQPSLMWYVRTGLNLLKSPVFRLRMWGRLPWPGRLSWHFMHQNYLAPDDPGTFLGFAERLTSREWQRESPEQLAKLLVGAFLEDLRAEYRGPFWSAGRRRTSYALVLLDNITRHNGGYTLQKTINNVRNDVGVHDPLLLITASAKVPPHAGEPGANGLSDVVFDATESVDGHDAWRNELTVKRRNRQEMAFYLPISTFNEPDEEQLATTRRLLRARKPVLTNPPWWSRRPLWLVIAFVVLFGLSGVYAYFSYSQCGRGWYPPSLNPTLSWENGECVGVTDGSRQPSPLNGTSLEDVQQRAWAQNAEVEDAGKYFTLVYFAALTPESGDPQNDGLASQRATLTGILDKQKENTGSRDLPNFRVAIANGGKSMGKGSNAADEIGTFAQRDESVVGVVGFDESSESTRSAIARLNAAGLPMVASNLSVPSFSGESPMYYSVSPQNDREAAMAGEYAQQLLERGEIDDEVHLITSGNPDDIYSQELGNAVERTMNERGLHTRRSNAKSACQKSTPPGQPKGLVYYAGRGVPEFRAFLNEVRSNCRDAAPRILGDDDVTTFVADATAKNDAAAAKFDFDFQSFSPAPGQEYDPNNALSQDGHVLLGSDAAFTMMHAVEQLQNNGIPVTPGSVWRWISQFHGTFNSIAGATGKIDFGNNVDNQFPIDKQLHIFRFEGPRQNTLQSSCGGTTPQNKTGQKQPLPCQLEPGATQSEGGAGGR